MALRGTEGGSETLGDWAEPIYRNDVKFGLIRSHFSTLGWRSALTLQQ